MAKLFEYAVIVEEKRDKGGEVVEEAELVVPVATILARDEDQAQLFAARAIPEEFVSNGKLDRLTVASAPTSRSRRRGSGLPLGLQQQAPNSALGGLAWQTQSAQPLVYAGNASQANYVSAAQVLNRG